MFLRPLAYLGLFFGLTTLLGCSTVLNSGTSTFDQAHDHPTNTDSEFSANIENSDFSFDPNCFVSEQEFNTYIDMHGADLWSRIRSGYRLRKQDHAKIDAEIRWYSRHPEYMLRVTKRARRYMFHIVESLEARNMPLEIALLPIVESAFDPFAYSHGRASGMWQIIPGTGKMLGLKQNWWYDGRRDVLASTDAALTYLERLNKRFDGDWLLALASYNSGAGNVSRAIRKNKKRGKPTDFWHLDLPRETKAYVPRLIALSKLIADPAKYTLSLTPIANEPHFEIVDVGSQIDLAQAASLAGINMDILYHLNPAFNRWATDPKGPHTLLVPVGKGDQLREKVSAIPANERVTWERYTIKNGDSLSTIAKRYKISVSSLKTLNKLRSNTIGAGKTLMVPMATESGQHYSYSMDERIAKRHAAVDKKHKGSSINYVVKQGDSLWSIGRQYKVSTRALARWNSMAPGDPIRLGQTLKIWTTNPKVPSLAKSTGVIRKLFYKVRSGDSLARIAQKFKLSVSDIVGWNQIQSSKYLQPGQKLTLFVDVTKS